jgi:proteic killer suppression protein
MEIVFEQKYLEDLYYKGKTNDKKHRFQPQIVKKYINVINLMESVRRVEDLFPYASLNYEVLHGDKAGLESVRVNNQYRIEFRSEIINKEQSITICNILELSNHYK